MEGEHKLTLRTEEGEREVKWGMPSPGLASKYQENPKAKSARFLVSDLSLRNKVFEIMFDNDILIRIETV